jgi:hypothetical protein
MRPSLRFLPSTPQPPKRPSLRPLPSKPRLPKRLSLKLPWLKPSPKHRPQSLLLKPKLPPRPLPLPTHPKLPPKTALSSGRACDSADAPNEAFSPRQGIFLSGL